jgi:outer membrane protein OmpA-like peptidoglycan-associated protein
MEILGRYPQIRVVCTGHADASGDRAPNYQLSKRRAQAVRSYLLQSGVTDDRVLLNFFGEERGRQSGSEDRRVEVTFYVE